MYKYGMNKSLQWPYSQAVKLFKCYQVSVIFTVAFTYYRHFTYVLHPGYISTHGVSKLMHLNVLVI